MAQRGGGHGTVGRFSCGRKTGTTAMGNGFVNPDATLEACGIPGVGTAHYNLTAPALYQMAMQRGEASAGAGGTLLVTTGKRTGRSPRDKFIVREPGYSDSVCWDSNSAMDPDRFETLQADMIAHLRGKECFVQDMHCGADAQHRINVRLVATLAWHSLFFRHLLRMPGPAGLSAFAPDCTIISCPGFRADPNRHGCRSDAVIAMSFRRKTILIAGTGYAGESKKSVFSYLNYTYPDAGVMPMHCSANHANGNPDDVAVFFGLSGTGKTTLSTDPARTLIGDDEHGWSDNGTFNLEGGCYAKTIGLDPASEPEIYATTRMFGTVIENMVFDPHTREPDYRDASISENMRCAYPLSYIGSASGTGVAGVPRHIFMLTCDAFGVLPPIARLTPEQAVYHFLSGFTSKTPGTEQGVAEPQPTFSACYGAPFMPRRAEEYGALLRERIRLAAPACWLVNTGWTGGAYGVGRRIPIGITRRLLSLALDGALAGLEFRRDPDFGFEVPLAVPGIDSGLLRPRDTWEDPAAHERQTARLLSMFTRNFEKFDIGPNRGALSELRAAC